ncbi:MAG TPA: hypothetical protein VGP79_16035 [Bryobacteraceae bacterium]|jgi:hypothetical protein|nr:hypothetical protein [Bryobacteraceae bacterium]
MSDAASAATLEGLLDPLSRCLDAESARRVAEFQIAPQVQERIGALAERANEGLLTDDERAEYEAVINAADFISILKLKARRQLSASGA